MELRDIRRLYDIRAILHVPGNKKVVVCPLPGHSHHDYTPSFSIFFDRHGVQRWHCHGNCGLAGDVIDLSGYMNISGYNPEEPEHIKMAVNFLSSKQEIFMPVKPDPPKVLPPDLWRSFLPIDGSVMRYAYMRGLNDETLIRFRFGSVERWGRLWLTLPTFREGHLRGVKLRNITTDGLRYAAWPGSLKGLFNYDGVVYRTDPLLIVKGEIAAALLVQHGFLACAPTGGEGSSPEELRTALALSRKKVVVGDNDKDPAVRAKTQEQARTRAVLYAAEVAFPPPQYKDIDEFFLAEPQHASDQIRRWLEDKWS